MGSGVRGSWPVGHPSGRKWKGVRGRRQRYLLSPSPLLLLPYPAVVLQVARLPEATGHVGSFFTAQLSLDSVTLGLPLSPEAEAGQ